MEALAPQTYTRWTDRLAMDVALLLEGSGETMDELLRRHGLGAEVVAGFNTDPLFHRKVRELRTEDHEKGITFRMKARAQAEELLETSYLMIHNPATPHSVRADLIKHTVKWAALEPKGDVEAVGDIGGVTISINIGGQELKASVRDVTPEPVVIGHGEV